MNSIVCLIGTAKIITSDRGANSLKSAVARHRDYVKHF